MQTVENVRRKGVVGLVKRLNYRRKMQTTKKILGDRQRRMLTRGEKVCKGERESYMMPVADAGWCVGVQAPGVCTMLGLERSKNAIPKGSTDRRSHCLMKIVRIEFPVKRGVAGQAGGDLLHTRI